MSGSKRLLKLGNISLIFFLILGFVSIGFTESTYAAESVDPTEGKTEKEIEKEVNDFIAEQEQNENEIAPAAADPHSQCVANTVAAEYGDIMKFTAVSAAFSNPSWANFKKAAKQLAKKGFKGSIVGIAYNLFTAYEKCQGAGTVA